MKIYYSVQNGGDGSAYPKFFQDEAAAEWDQREMDEGWGESCTGSLDIKGSDITVPEALSNLQYFLEMVDEAYDEDDNKKANKFFKELMGGKFPKLTGTKSKSCDEYNNIYIKCGGKRVARFFEEKKVSVKSVLGKIEEIANIDE